MRGQIFLYVVISMMTAVVPTANVSMAAVNLAADKTGLIALTSGDVNFLANPSGCVVARIAMEGVAPAEGNESPGGFSTRVAGDTSARIFSVARRYAWGSLECRYSTAGARVNADIRVSNDGQQRIARIVVIVLRLKSPESISTFDQTRFNLEGPSFATLLYPDSKVLIATNDLARLNCVSIHKAPSAVEVILENRTTVTVQPATQTGKERYGKEEVGNLIAPAMSERWSLSVRLANNTMLDRSVLSDLTDSYAHRFPPAFFWGDRRPIGAIFLASHVPGQTKDAHNPRFWRLPGGQVHVDSPEGRVDFQRRLLRRIDDAVAFLRKINSQGAVVWDIEGQEYEQPVSYVGDPRQLSPEMQGVVDQLFERFTDNGLRCGVTIRPQTFTRENGSGAQLFDENPDKIVSVLDAKIKYAQHRWKCSLYYIDSNGDPNWPIDVSVLRRLAALHPDVMLIPENKTILSYAYSSPYCDVRHLELCASNEARWLYPHAFSVINITALPGQIDSAELQDLVSRVKDGDLLMIAAPRAPLYHGVSDIYRLARSRAN